MIDLSKVKEITIKEGSVSRITDSNGVVWWEKKPSVDEGLSMLVRYNDGTDKKFYNLTSIDNITVSNKANAVSVEIYDGVTSIGDDAFSGCISLSSVTIPNSVTSIGNYTFIQCSSLSSITIPNSVKTMGGSVFWSCSSLSSVTIESTTKLTYNRNAFANIASNAVLRVPSNLVEEYQADTQWTNAFKGGIKRIGAVGELENGSGSIGGEDFEVG